MPLKPMMSELSRTVSDPTVIEHLLRALTTLMTPYVMNEQDVPYLDKMLIHSVVTAPRYLAHQPIGQSGGKR